MLTKNQLKALWREHDFRPLKRFGQNFLIDKNVKEKIIANLKLSKDDTVLEIGPGFCEITEDIAKRVKKVFAVEKDKKLLGIVKKSFRLPKNITLIEKDFLEVDIEKLAGKKPLIIVGNLPYYITSPIIEKILSNISVVKDIYLLVQKELADRISAKPGSRDIGRLSLFVQYYTDPERLFTVKGESFYPTPEVESALLRLSVPKEKQVTARNEELLFKVIKTAYSQRRKTILNSLSGMQLDKKALASLLENAGINPKARAEELALGDFVKLSNSFLN